MPEPFATASDLADRWRPLEPAEQSRASILLEDASSIIRAVSRGIDAKIEAGELDLNVPKAIACAMVKRVMQTTGGLDGVTQQSEAAGPFSHSFAYANPTGDLYLTKGERQRLGIGGQRAGSVDMLAAAESTP